MDKGMIHIYYGDGKGKTTAAIGLGVRAAGRGLSVFLVRFLKTADSGELESLRYVPGFAFGDSPAKLPFYFDMTHKEKAMYNKYAYSLWQSGVKKAIESKADVIIFDEILDAVSLGILDESEISEFLRARPKNVEVVLTGRSASPDLIAAADYVSRITAEKHPFEKGFAARNGIEL